MPPTRQHCDVCFHIRSLSISVNTKYITNPIFAFTSKSFTGPPIKKTTKNKSSFLPLQFSSSNKKEKFAILKRKKENLHFNSSSETKIKVSSAIDTDRASKKRMNQTTLGDVIEHKAYARIGLLGNPSDVYYGNTISISITNFWASVKLEPSDRLVINPHPFHDLVQFHSLNHLVNRLENEGFYGGVRLVMAICKVFYKYCKKNNIDLHEGRFTLSYDTNIPRQTGLSGSSAIVCATLNCILDFYKVRHQVKVQDRPTLILEAEKELGIVAGLQDRVAQVYGGLVFMDFSKTQMDRLGHGIYTPMDISLLPPLYLIYAANPSDSGKVHSTVRQRWLDGDEFIRSTMNEVANLAVEGRQALLEKDYAKLASLMNHNFDLRRSMFGDDALGAINLRMVEVARDAGAASKFTGSGGAVVAFCPDGPPQVELLQEACLKAGFIIQPVQVAPSFLNDLDLGSSSST